MNTILVALLANMIGNEMLAPNQPRPNGLPILYRCEMYPQAKINPENFDMVVTQGLRNCVAMREMTFPEYLDWRDEQAKKKPAAPT